MSELRQLADPHLATLRTAGRALTQRDADTWEQARFHLFRALEDDDEAAASDWLNALEAHIAVFSSEFSKAHGNIRRAMDEIKRLIG